jgi:hypothetical protein
LIVGFPPFFTRIESPPRFKFLELAFLHHSVAWRMQALMNSPFAESWAKT